MRMLHNLVFVEVLLEQSLSKKRPQSCEWQKTANAEYSDVEEHQPQLQVNLALHCSTWRPLHQVPLSTSARADGKAASEQHAQCAQREHFRKFYPTYTNFYLNANVLQEHMYWRSLKWKRGFHPHQSLGHRDTRDVIPIEHVWLLSGRIS